jgi:hypothetical protein
MLLCLFVVTWFFTQPVLCPQKSATSQPTAPAIRVESAVASDSGEMNRKVKTLENPPATADTVSSISRMWWQAWWEEKVKTIRVVRFAHHGNSATPDEVRRTIRKVWHGRFQSGFCQIAWAEGTFWSIEAVMEFEDGKESVLVIDGVHVALQDHEGKSWFFQLYLAAQ